MRRPRRFDRMASDGRCVVAAVIVDDHNRHWAAVVLPKQRGEALTDHQRLIASGDDHCYARPVAILQWQGCGFGIALACEPETTAQSEEVDPDGAGKQSDQQFRHRR